VSGDEAALQLELERAQGLVELRRYEEATTALADLVGREPELAPAWCLLAQAQIAVGETQPALEAANRAVALAPEHDWPYRLRSVALQQLGDDDGSIAAAREAVAAAPHNWQTHRRLAMALVLAKRDPDGALAAAGRAIELAPYEPDAFSTLGLVYDMRKNSDEAERCFRHALSLDPQHAPSHDALARRQLATSGFGRAGNLAAAATGFRDAVQADPRDHIAATNIEIVLRAFIARLSYFIFIVAWIAYHVTGGSAFARVGPLLLLALPVGFAARFLLRLPPDLRRQVRYVAFHGALAVPAILQSCALGLLLVAAVLPESARRKAALAAVLVSLAARVLLYVISRRMRRDHAA
jgi:tetratricopeptide (TPR) repeat protein